MTDEMLDRLDRFAVDATPDLDGLQRRADRLRARRRIAAGGGTVLAVVAAAVTLAAVLPSGPSGVEVAGPADGADSTDGEALTGDGPLGDAELSLRSLPQPDDTVLELYVLEQACASGGTAEGRVEVVGVERTADEVRLTIGVRPLGEAMCPSHPPTPFDLDLGEPLGDRDVVDAVTGRVLEVPRGMVVPRPAQTLDERVERALSWEPPTDYDLQVELLCERDCGPQVFNVLVEDGRRVGTSPVRSDEADEPFDVADVPTWAQLLTVLRAAWEADAILDLQLADDGRVLSVELAPPFAPTDALGWAFGEPMRFESGPLVVED